ncbi:MAG: DUF2058 domain-containing protein, partial [Gammaproteobacteria bacterium]|nr:DUF2058 domain-containing protein [Gammaproteobacteria bacterium]
MIRFVIDLSNVCINERESEIVSMGNPFQDQLLKAGIVSKKQVHKAKQEKNQQRKQQRSNKEKLVDKNKLKLQQAADEKTRRDRELNKKKEEQARQKAISAEINQLITDNCIARDESCDVVYNFEHNKKVKRIFVNAEMKQQIVQGKLGIARIEGRYELVTKAVAEKIQRRNAKRVVIYDAVEEAVDENDPYSDY